ncbi:MAG: ABC transporter ATP-binding protein [Rhodobacteraceae bacterium]|nr:ABC transporter ATP-binding protein [Paracoccaceae bacterium]
MPVGVLDVRNLRVAFRTHAGDFEAVRGVDLQIGRDEALAVIGESGSGKSVTASAIMGLIDARQARVTADRMLLEGRELLGLSHGERERINGARVAMVFQDALAHLNPVYPVGWQVAETCRLHGQTARAARARALELMEHVGIARARGRYDDYPHQFSGGERQRLLIAMAVAMRPALLVADEPTTALDVSVQAQILELLRSLRAETGMALMMITHDVGVAADIADRVVVMREGEVVESGTVREVLLAPRHPYTRALLSARAGAGAARGAGAGARQILLQAEGLTLTHPVRENLLGRPVETLTAVDGVDLCLREGEILGLVGESGSGKSSVARMLLGLTRPTAGSVSWRGQDLACLAGEGMREFRRGVQVVFQDPYSSLNPRLTVFDVISEAWRLNPDVVPRGAWRKRARELLLQVNLKASDLDKYPGEFSGGQLQRIAIARALALGPKVVVCDEAVSALDMSIQAQVVDLLTRLRDQTGVAYLFIAHDLTLVEHFADRVLVMQKGRIVEEGTPAEVFGAPRNAYTMALIAASPVPDPDLQAVRRRQRLGQVAEAERGTRP